MKSRKRPYGQDTAQIGGYRGGWGKGVTTEGQNEGISKGNENHLHFDSAVDYTSACMSQS